MKKNEHSKITVNIRLREAHTQRWKNKSQVTNNRPVTLLPIRQKWSSQQWGKVSMLRSHKSVWTTTEIGKTQLIKSVFEIYENIAVTKFIFWCVRVVLSRHTLTLTLSWRYSSFWGTIIIPFQCSPFLPQFVHRKHSHRTKFKTKWTFTTKKFSRKFHESMAESFHYYVYFDLYSVA